MNKSSLDATNKKSKWETNAEAFLNENQEIQKQEKV
jgi:hypothetical protein